MRSLILAIMLSVPCVAVAAPLKSAILSYTTESDAVLNWEKARFKFKINGRNPGDASIHWDTYYDIYGPASITELMTMKDWSLSNGVSAEAMLLHAKVDYTSALSTAWSQMDKFDNFEGAKGVMRTSDDIAYTDLTATAYSGSVTWQNTMYVGYEEPFDQINLVVSTAGTGISRTWEYWNGSAWTALTVTDGTSLFASTGQVYFVPPSSWSRKSVNGSRSKYFVRCRVTAASIYPVTSSVKGDNWLRGANNLCRGWDGTNGSIVNTGELKYNATPPAGSAAKFPYQARVSYWGSNHFIANPADFQTIGGTSTRTWAKYAAYRINALVTASGFTGVMCDDGERNISADGIAAASTDFADKTGNTWAVEAANKYGDIVSMSHALNGGIKVGINAQTRTSAILGDWNLAEYHTYTWKTRSPRNITVSDSTTLMTYDDFATSGTDGVMIYQDTADTVPDNGVTVWERGNRGPLAALSKHYIAMNDNTYFSYYTQGGFVYSNTDEVYLKDGSTLHQATDAIPSASLVKRWATYFPAMAVDMGTPGAKNFLWKSHTEIGGTQDVWRRDFANGIVLHRPAMYNTPDSEYTTYSSAMDLGGSYYPLYADGTTGAAVTSIALRAGEGAILLSSGTVPPPVTSTRSLNGRLSGRIR